MAHFELAFLCQNSSVPFSLFRYKSFMSNFCIEIKTQVSPSLCSGVCVVIRYYKKLWNIIYLTATSYNQDLLKLLFVSIRSHDHAGEVREILDSPNELASTPTLQTTDSPVGCCCAWRAKLAPGASSAHSHNS